MAQASVKPGNFRRSVSTIGCPWMRVKIRTPSKVLLYLATSASKFAKVTHWQTNIAMKNCHWVRWFTVIYLLKNGDFPVRYGFISPTSSISDQGKPWSPSCRGCQCYNSLMTWMILGTPPYRVPLFPITRRSEFRSFSFKLDKMEWMKLNAFKHLKWNDCISKYGISLGYEWDMNGYSGIHMICGCVWNAVYSPSSRIFDVDNND